MIEIFHGPPMLVQRETLTRDARSGEQQSGQRWGRKAAGVENSAAIGAIGGLYLSITCTRHKIVRQCCHALQNSDK